MNLIVMVVIGAHERVPRTRGDEPPAYCVLDVPEVRSPHARG